MSIITIKYDSLLERRQIFEKVDRWYQEATGHSMKESWPSLYEEWNNKARITRNHVIHRGKIASQEEGKDAFSAVFNLMLAIDPEEFYVP